MNAILNRIGRLTPRSPTFSDSEKFEILNNNPMIIDTNLAAVIVQPGHDLEWKKRSIRIWKEHHFDDAELLALFPTLSERDIHSLTGGPYQLRKAQGYKNQIINYLQDRKRQLVDGGSNRTTSTVSTLNSSFAMKIQVLREPYLGQYFRNEFTSCVRLDMPSYHSKYRKFKTNLLIRNINGQSPKFSFGCLCSTRLRTTPCAHSVVLLFLYAHLFKHQGFPSDEQRLPI